MARKSMIIIGAGVAGLSTGSYCQMNGYDSQIFEMNDKPGGLCTSWERNGYRIDGCPHWLVGTSPQSTYYHLWQEVGVVQGKQILNLEILLSIEGKNGQVLNLYTDTDRLAKHMREIAPEDSDFIDQLTNAIRRLTGFGLPVDKPLELFGTLDNLKMLAKVQPFLEDLKKWGKMTMRDLSEHFQNPFLRQAWQMVWPLDFSCLYVLITLAWMAQKNAGYIVGGSREIDRAMEKRYLDLNGQIHYKARVSKILVEDHRAVGIKLENGNEYKADFIISAADGHATIFDLLEGRYVDDKIRGYYDKMPVYKPLVFIGLGINRSFEDLPKIFSGIVFPMENPILIGNQEIKYLGVRINNFDPTLAPPGKTVLTLRFESEYAYWESLHNDLPRYNAEKEKIADAVIAALDKRFPGLASQVEVRDVATPVTFNRYTGNWQGSYEGWLMTPDNITLQIKKTLPGLSNFYMVGQWVQPGGGLAAGLVTGCHVTQVLCKGDKKRYCAVCPR